MNALKIQISLPEICFRHLYSDNFGLLFLAKASFFRTEATWTWNGFTRIKHWNSWKVCCGNVSISIFKHFAVCSV